MVRTAQNLNLISQEREQLLLSVIVPCFDEDTRIDILRSGIIDFIKEVDDFNFEVLLINDGSRDTTFMFLKKLADEFNSLPFGGLQRVRVLNLEENLGKGGALRTGVLAAQGSWVLTIDADMATPITQVLKWHKEGSVDLYDEETINGNSLFIGSRRNDQVKNSLLRNIMSRFFNFIVRILLKIKQTDTQCGFKLYPTKVARACFSNLKDWGWAHDLEVLKRGKIEGHTIVPLPVQWKAVEGSKIRIVRDTINMFLSIFKIRDNISKDRKKFQKK